MGYSGVDYYNIDDLLSDEEKMIRSRVREFMGSEIAPLVINAFHREEPIDMQVIAPRMGELGMIGSFIPKEYGAAGSNY
ncbi:MAG: acyl-CoA dehydrogenase family protein, partial [Chloroflexi bacterium]|nr:acyl-CoA dehydrogenase family protein [Chloroflexota bacterium]